MAKIEVNGNSAHDSYKFLKESASLEKIKWNFAKFLIDKKGKVFKAYEPKIHPD
jgi:glutathione peroxidase